MHKRIEIVKEYLCIMVIMLSMIMTNMMLRSYQIKKHKDFHLEMLLEFSEHGWRMFIAHLLDRLEKNKEWTLRVPSSLYLSLGEDSLYEDASFTLFWKKKSGNARALLARPEEKSFVATLCFSEEGFQDFKKNIFSLTEYSFSSQQTLDPVSNFHIILKKEKDNE
jgi:hypothetical protein